MPYYGTPPQYLKKSVESILSQSYENLELIVVADLPNYIVEKKKIEYVLDDFKDDKRLRRILHKSRRGLVYSLNEALTVSKGDYIARADADDICMPFRIERQINYMLANEYHMTGSWALVIDENDKVISQVRKPVTPNEIRSKIMLHNPFLHSTVLIKKKVLENVGFYDPKFEYSEDYELWLRIISKGYSCANYPSYLVLIRETRASITRGSKWFKNRIAYLKCKMHAHKKYGFNKFFDNIYLAITPLALLTNTRMGLIVKRVLGYFGI
jgi:glycosyltransferase involved in cell wall biosynthesis